MRYALTAFLGALLLMVVGLSLGVLSFDQSSEGQYSAAGTLAYYECDEYECLWVDEDDRAWDGGAYLSLPPDVAPPDELDIGGELYVRDDNDAPPSWWELDDDDDDDDVLSPWVEIYDDDIPSWGYWHDDIEPTYWIEEDDGFYVQDIIVIEDPWYVSAFPGFGEVAQRIIPGQAPVARPARAPAPASAPRVIYPQPSCWISAQPMRVAYGGSSLLQWSSFNATRATLTDFGDVSTVGYRTVTGISGQGTYTLAVSGQGGAGSCYTRISVEALGSPPSCIISANPETISRGQTASLAWGGSDASSALLSGVGPVNVRGGTYVAPAQSTTYTLSVYGTGGRSSSCSARVNVRP